MCAGEFVNVYEEQYGAWDVTRLSLQALRFKMILVPVQAVLTCFFLDTAKNVFPLHSHYCRHHQAWTGTSSLSRTCETETNCKLDFLSKGKTVCRPGGLWANIGPPLVLSGPQG